MIRNPVRTSACVGIGVGAAALCWVWAAGPSPAQPIDMNQLEQVLRGEGPPEAEYTDEFFLEDLRFSYTGRNRFFSLEPGYRLHLAGESDGEQVELFITVLRETRLISMVVDGRLLRVRARVIEEREFKDGALFEVSRNFYARCTRTNDIFYFGEEVCFFEGDQCVDDAGAWLAGQDGALPGIIMPGSFLLGSRYFQELAPGVALDRAEHVEMGQIFTVPAGVFEDCVVVLETNELEPNSESVKVYCPGVGLVVDDELVLVSYGFGG